MRLAGSEDYLTLCGCLPSLLLWALCEDRRLFPLKKVEEECWPWEAEGVPGSLDGGR